MKYDHLVEAFTIAGGSSIRAIQLVTGAVGVVTVSSEMWRTIAKSEPMFYIYDESNLLV